MLPDIRLGPTDITLRPLGVGIWQWGDRRFWSYDPQQGPRAVEDAFHASLDAGVTLFDTAEMYGRGESERILGRLMRETGRRPLVATKFAPLPYRVTSGSLTKALDASLERLGMETVDLYQIHFPYSVLRIESLMGRLADAVKANKVRFVGVSNYSEKQMRRAHRELAGRGVPLVSNQVNYSLLQRKPERSGLLGACRELDVTLIAYSPIAQGALTGKYGPGRGNPTGVRRFTSTFRNLKRAMPLVQELEAIGREHGRTAAQVALNWLARQDHVLPIPGAKNGRQAAENAGAIDFALTEEQVARLDRLSRPRR